jgi:hypothetical protein
MEFSTPIVNGLITFFAWYVLVGAEFGYTVAATMTGDAIDH